MVDVIMQAMSVVKLGMTRTEEPPDKWLAVAWVFRLVGCVYILYVY